METQHERKFVVLGHTNYPGKMDHFDVLMAGAIAKELGEDMRSLLKFETRKEPSGIITARYRGNISERYLTYEGQMSGNRGFVKRVDEGIWQVGEDGTITFSGNKLKGNFNWMLRRIR